MAAILWKIKQKYDMFRRRQRLFVEMEQMASRPFSQVHEFLCFSPLLLIHRSHFSHQCVSFIFQLITHHHFFSFLFFRLIFTLRKVLVELDSKEYNEITPTTDTNTTTAKKRKKDSPSPIALEPCAGNKAAVLSLLVRLPTGEFNRTEQTQFSHENGFQ